MTNSESPSPKKDEDSHDDYSFSAESDRDNCDDEFHDIEINAAINDLNCRSGSRSKQFGNSYGATSLAVEGAPDGGSFLPNRQLSHQFDSQQKDQIKCS